MSSDGKKRPPDSKPRIVTFADLNLDGDGGGDVPMDGTPVQDPSTKLVDAIFKRVIETGGVPCPPETEASRSRSFTGTARFLSGETVPSASPQRSEIIHTITFWTNGFTVNDGPLRRFSDPEPDSFLESITRSECPEELQPSDGKTRIGLKLVRKREDYLQPMTSPAAFQGVGRSLGSASSEESPVSTSASATATHTQSISFASLAVDESLPSTSIQLRLADGTRMVARFNLHHTVGHIRAFINASTPGSAMNYRLRTSDIPTKQLTDETTTIEQAGLANSVVIQSL